MDCVKKRIPPVAVLTWMGANLALDKLFTQSLGSQTNSINTILSRLHLPSSGAQVTTVPVAASSHLRVSQLIDQLYYTRQLIQTEHNSEDTCTGTTSRGQSF